MSNLQNQHKILLPTGDTQKACALVAEANEDNRFLLTTLLSIHGLDVVEAQTAEDAIEIVANNSLDLILIDTSLPQYGGIETTRHIRELKLLYRTPIIVLSSHAQAKVRMEAFEAGCDDYVVKPFEIEQLINVIEKQLQKKRCFNLNAGL